MKLALIQQAFKGTKEATNAYTTKLIAQAAKKKADLVCLNELHQAPYFCQSEDVLNFDLAKDYEKDLEFWSKEAKKNNIILLTSLFEKRTCGLYHNTAVVFEKDGSIAGRYRKMHIPEDPNFYEKFYFTQGDLGFEPINTSVGRLGVLVCWDQWFPEAARIMALKGAQILIYPTAIGWFDSDSEAEKQRQLEAWIAVQRGHAVANGLSVVAINRAGFEGAYLSKPSLESKLLDKKALKAKNHALKEDNKLNSKRFAKDTSVDGIRFWGNSFVFGPQGEELFRANSVDEGVFFVEIDLDRNEEVRRWWQFFRDRRIDFYKPLLKRFDD